MNRKKEQIDRDRELAREKLLTRMRDKKSKKSELDSLKKSENASAASQADKIGEFKKIESEKLSDLHARGGGEMSEEIYKILAPRFAFEDQNLKKKIEKEKLILQKEKELEVETERERKRKDVKEGDLANYDEETRRMIGNLRVDLKYRGDRRVRTGCHQSGAVTAGC